MTLMSRVREHAYTVVENEAVGDGIWRMVFRAPKLAGSLEPGQFMNFHVPGAKQILRVPLSFASADAGSGTVEIVYAVVGDATRALTRMAAGESSSVLGPSGNGWVVRKGQGRSVVVGGGVGAPPAIAAAGLLTNKGVAFDGVLGAQTASKLWGVDRLAELGAGRVRASRAALAGRLRHGLHLRPAGHDARHRLDLPRGGHQVPGLHGAHDVVRFRCVQHLQRAHGRRHLQVVLHERPHL